MEIRDHFTNLFDATGGNSEAQKFDFMWSVSILRVSSLDSTSNQNFDNYVIFMLSLSWNIFFKFTVTYLIVTHVDIKHYT